MDPADISGDEHTIERVAWHRRMLWQWTVLSAALLMLGAAIAFNIVVHHERTVAVEQHKLQMQLHTVATTLRTQIGRVRQVLDALNAVMPRSSDLPGSLPSEDFLRTLNLGMIGVRSLNVADADGTILRSNRPELLGQVVPLPEVSATAQGADDLLYVVPPPGNVRDAAAVSIVRIVRSESGEITGAVFANLDKGQLQRHISSVLYSDDMWTTIAFEDGSAVLQAYGAAQDGGPQATVRTEVDPDDTELSTDLIVEMGRDLDAIYVQWWDDLRRRVLFYLVFVVTTTGGLWLYQRRQRQAQAHISSALTALRNSEEGFRLIVEHTLDAVVRFTPDGHYTYANPAYCRLIGLPASRLIGRSVMRDVASTDVLDAQRRFKALLEPPYTLSFSQKHQTPRGTLHVEWVAQAIRDARGRILSVIAVGSDVTKQVQAAEALRAEAEKDFLTGLGNRRYFDQKLEAVFRRARAEGDNLSLIILDLDHFKSINDTYGHAAGDVVLQQIGRRLQDALRGRDVVARIGGEEFGILMPGAPLGKAREAGERLRQSISSQPVTLDDNQQITVTASLGIATLALPGRMDANQARGVDEGDTDEADDTTETLFQRADQALYRAKASGRNRVLMSETA